MTSPVLFQFERFTVDMQQQIDSENRYFNSFFSINYFNQIMCDAKFS